MSIRINLECLEESKNAVCHLLPCKIKHNGQADVTNYFAPYICKEENVLKCSLRGHPLLGQEVKVPSGYTGVVLKEHPGLSDCNDKRELKLTSEFKRFTFWNWDREPAPDDKIIKALDWFDVATALHKKVKNGDNEVSLDKESKNSKKRKLSETSD